MPTDRPGAVTPQDVDWEFGWEVGQFIESQAVLDEEEEEFPYWEVKHRFYDPDRFMECYSIHWMHPVTWRIENTVVDQGNMTYFEPVDEETVKERARELIDDAE